MEKGSPLGWVSIQRRSANPLNHGHREVAWLGISFKVSSAKKQMTKPEKKVDAVSSARSEGQARWTSVLEFGAIAIARHKSGTNIADARQGSRRLFSIL